MDTQLNIDNIKTRLQGIAEATSFCLNSFAAYVENKESYGTRQTHYSKDSSTGILFINTLIQEEHERILTDIKVRE